jgi:hypothetical protein
MKETGQKGKVMNNMEMKSSNVSEVRIKTKVCIGNASIIPAGQAF